MSTTSIVKVTRTYLEMRDPESLNAAVCDDPRVGLEQIADCPASLFRYLYTEVGRNYHWIDRLGWTDEEIVTHVNRPEVSLWLLTQDDGPAGYFELCGCEDGSIEIAYFGLLPGFIGRGLGKYLLSRAVTQAWASGANRIWLHTCTLDDPAAMPNYLKRGFTPFKMEEYSVEL
jgi:GNAT superfamily N-acetyltransferase